MITNVKNITITKSILHIINKNNSHINKALLPNTDTDFNEFLAKHIRSCINTRSRKSAIFKHKDRNNIYTYTLEMFKNDSEFIENSRVLADLLKSICLIKNAGPYDLIFCEYINDDDEKYLAIILLELTKSFFHEIKDSDAIIKHLDVLASNSSNFKKCALIPLDSTNMDYDLIVNDKHSSDFFLNDFLDSNLYMDDRKATATLIEQTIVWVNNKCEDPAFTTQMKEKLENVKSTCISSISEHTTIDIEAFENSVFRDDIAYLKDEYNSHLEQNNLINKEIIINDDVASDYKCQKVKLNTGIEIKIPIEIINNTNYNNEYNRCIEDDGNTKFILFGKIESESVKSR
nr:nucleoid-associated protein [Clostridium neonatale]